MGIKQASGDIIAFVDDDVLLYPDWAENMVKAFHMMIPLLGLQDRHYLCGKTIQWRGSRRSFTGLSVARPGMLKTILKR